MTDVTQSSSSSSSASSSSSTHIHNPHAMSLDPALRVGSVIHSSTCFCHVCGRAHNDADNRLVTSSSSGGAGDAAASSGGGFDAGTRQCTGTRAMFDDHPLHHYRFVVASSPLTRLFDSGDVSDHTQCQATILDLHAQNKHLRDAVAVLPRCRNDITVLQQTLATLLLERNKYAHQLQALERTHAACAHARLVHESTIDSLREQVAGLALDRDGKIATMSQQLTSMRTRNQELTQTVADLEADIVRHVRTNEEMSVQLAQATSAIVDKQDAVSRLTASAALSRIAATDTANATQTQQQLLLNQHAEELGALQQECDTWQRRYVTLQETHVDGVSCFSLDTHEQLQQQYNAQLMTNTELSQKCSQIETMHRTCGSDYAQLKRQYDGLIQIHRGCDAREKELTRQNKALSSIVDKMRTSAPTMEQESVTKTKLRTMTTKVKQLKKTVAEQRLLIQYDEDVRNFEQRVRDDAMRRVAAFTPQVGVSFKDPRSASNRADSRGLKVAEVAKGKPGEAAGIQKDDIIAQIKGRPTLSMRDWRDSLRKCVPGDDVAFQIQRGRVTHTKMLRLSARGYNHTQVMALRALAAEPSTFVDIVCSGGMPEIDSTTGVVSRPGSAAAGSGDGGVGGGAGGDGGSTGAGDGDGAGDETPQVLVDDGGVSGHAWKRPVMGQMPIKFSADSDDEDEEDGDGDGDGGGDGGGGVGGGNTVAQATSPEGVVTTLTTTTEEETTTTTTEETTTTSTSEVTGASSLLKPATTDAMMTATGETKASAEQTMRAAI